MIWLNSKLIILTSMVTNWRARGVAGSSLSKYLINCLVLVQPDFDINEVLNSNILCVGVGEGFAIEWGCLVILGSH